MIRQCYSIPEFTIDLGNSGKYFFVYKLTYRTENRIRIGKNFTDL